MSYNVIQLARHNILRQFHVEKYLYQKTNIEKGYLPLNREAINGEITGLESIQEYLALSPTSEHLPLFFLSSFVSLVLLQEQPSLF